MPSATWAPEHSQVPRVRTWLSSGAVIQEGNKSQTGSEGREGARRESGRPVGNDLEEAREAWVSGEECSGKREQSTWSLKVRGNRAWWRNRKEAVEAGEAPRRQSARSEAKEAGGSRTLIFL